MRSALADIAGALTFSGVVFVLLWVMVQLFKAAV